MLRSKTKYLQGRFGMSRFIYTNVLCEICVCTNNIIYMHYILYIYINILVYACAKYVVYMCVCVYVYIYIYLYNTWIRKNKIMYIYIYKCICKYT